MPKPVLDEEVQQEVAFTPLAIDSEQLPVFAGAKVVYLGTRPKMSLSMKGRMNVNRAVLPDGRTIETRKPGRQNGRQFYGFELHDDHGQLNPRRMPADHPIHVVRDKPYSVVEHADHLYEFAGTRNFQIVFPDRDTERIFAEYVLRRDRARAGSIRQDLGELTGSREEVVTAR